jgi:UTP--glucose-1-phosphate uridylyltransferase
MAATTAVVPVAGRGTRLRPLTHAVPKELLPLGRRPVLDHVLDELAAAGIERFVLVTSAAKPAIAEHVRATGRAGVELVVQPEPRGLGDAVLQAAGRVDEPFVVACGDSLLRPDGAAVARMLAAPEPGAIALVAVDDPSAYGVARVAGGRVTELVEKPPRGAAPSNLAVAARWKLPPSVFDALRATAPGVGGEIQLTDAIAALLAEGTPFAAVPLAPGESRLDIGDVDAYLAAFRAVTA